MRRMLNEDIKFAFSPTLLDAWRKYTDITPEEYFYQDNEGKWHLNSDLALTPEEVYELAYQDMLDTLNRTKVFESEAMSKGTAFNELIDKYIKEPLPEGEYLEASADGQHFIFSRSLVENVCERLKGSIAQYYTAGIIPTMYGNVAIYGYPDYILRDMVIDLKTTKSFECGNYYHYHQRFAYPLILEQEGMQKDCSNFAFLVVEWRQKKVTFDNGNTYYVFDGEVFEETYPYYREESLAILRETSEQLIGFIQSNKDKLLPFNELQTNKIKELCFGKE